MSDLVRGWISKQGEGIWVGCQICEQAKEIFGVELTSFKGSCDVDPTLNIIGEDTGIDGFCLLKKVSWTFLSQCVINPT